MKREEVHAIWARQEDPWRAWVKPVLFAALPADVVPQPPESARDLVRDADLERRLLEPLHGKREKHAADGHPYRRDSLRDTAIVVDFAGARSVHFGAALAQHGFRPVPLFNALPAPEGARVIVDLSGVMRALVDNAPPLAALPLGLPPCFLLDADRMGGGAALWAGMFDNRSVCRPVDFPSPDTLYSAGIRRFVVLRRSPSVDLDAVLASWKKRGMNGFAPASVAGQSLRRIDVRAPSWVRRAADGLRHPPLSAREDGSFGKFIPHRGAR